eukprot:2426848-Pleurochrysis_carterae.AAC.8
MRRALLLILASHSYIAAWALAATQPLKIRRVFLSPSALNLACNGDVLKTCCRFRDAGVTQVAALASSTDEEAMAQPLLADGAVDSIVSATEESARLPGASDLVVCASIPELAAVRLASHPPRAPAPGHYDSHTQTVCHLVCMPYTLSF